MERCDCCKQYIEGDAYEVVVIKHTKIREYVRDKMTICRKCFLREPMTLYCGGAITKGRVSWDIVIRDRG